jgi:hypothetical protein
MHACWHHCHNHKIFYLLPTTPMHPHTHLLVHPAAGLSPAATCSHLGWLCRQHTVAAEMIRARPLDEALMALHRECQPHMLLLAAAQVAVRRRQLADELRAGGRQPAGTDLSAVRKGPHIGQLVARWVLRHVLCALLALLARCAVLSHVQTCCTA